MIGYRIYECHFEVPLTEVRPGICYAHLVDATNTLQKLQEKYPNRKYVIVEVIA